MGGFCKMFQLAPSTVRYYIKEGLLIPESGNRQFVFNEECVSDMQLIQQLKDCGFSLREIHETLSLYRISRFAAPEDQRSFHELFYKKRAELVTRLAATEQTLLQLSSLAAKNNSDENEAGL